MPLYPFVALDTQEEQDIFFSMKEVPPLGSVITYEGREWKRIFITSSLAMAGLKPVDPHSAKDFIRKTGEMKGGTMGDMWDLSKQLSEQRAAVTGVDPVKKRFYDNYAKTHKGNRHPKEAKEKAQAATKKLSESIGIDIKLA